MINHFQSLSQSKRPKNNKSYDLLVKYADDSLILVKFQFFKDIASILSSYLVKFQTDAPIMPFVSGVLEGTLRQLMKMFLHKTVVDEATTPYKLMKSDLEKKENFLLSHSVKLPTATNALLSSSKSSQTQKRK